MLRCTLTISTIALLLAAQPSLAHKTPAKRKVMVTVKSTPAGTVTEALVWMRLGGPRGKRFVSQFDLDKDGQFNPLEAQQLANTLGPEAIGGFYLSWNKQPLTPQSADAKARLTGPGTVEVAILLSYAPRDLGEGRLKLASHPGRDRPGTHPHLGEVGVLPPLMIQSEGQFSNRMAPRKVTAKAPIDLVIQRAKPMSGVTR